MADFINTIDVLGDAAVTDSILARTITEFKDNRITKVGTYAFCSCTALESVEIPNATLIDQNAFQGCSALKRLDLPSVTQEIKTNAFNGCSAMTALILRQNKVLGLATTYVFSNTPIANGTGYVYVPAALVDSYKAGTLWSNFAEQIRAIEDYTVDGTVDGELDESKI